MGTSRATVDISDQNEFSKGDEILCVMGKVDGSVLPRKEKAKGGDSNLVVFELLKSYRAADSRQLPFLGHVWQFSSMRARRILEFITAARNSLCSWEEVVGEAPEDTPLCANNTIRSC